MSPKISVVMAVNNAERFLKEAIESILIQNFTDFEFIIINDGSTDRSLEIIKSYIDKRIILINQDNQGLSKSLNSGIEVAKSELIARMDADDVSDVKRLETQYDFMNTHLNCVLLGTNAIVIDLNGSFLYNSNLPTDDESIRNKLPESSFFHSSTIFRKSSFYKAEKYPSEIFHYFEDKVLWNKMAKFGELRNIEEPLINYRIVPESISNLPNKNIAELNQVANKIIANDYVFETAEVQKIKDIVTIPLKKRYANYYLRIGALYLSDKKIWRAFKNLLISFYYQPFESNTTIRLIACLIPHSLYKKLKESKNN
jgi:glycosyltransferase involved in cell wall biosynthesis